MSHQPLAPKAPSSEAVKQSYVFESANLSQTVKTKSSKDDITLQSSDERPSLLRHTSTDILKNNDMNFIKSRNSKYWTHGFPLPHTVLKYTPISDSNKLNSFVSSTDRQMFDPLLTFEPINYVQHENIKKDKMKRNSLSSHPQAPGTFTGKEDFSSRSEGTVKLKDYEIFGKYEEAKGFQGYYSIPNATMNVPEPPKIALKLRNGSPEPDGDGKEPLVSAEDAEPVTPISLQVLPTVVFHCYHNTPEGNFVFGGLYTDIHVGFKSLGIPSDVEIENISVHFPCELPPHIDREIIMNPYIIMNPHFFCIKPLTGTVTVLDSFATLEVPRFCQMTAVKISKRQIFFYGGFLVENISSEYLPESNRWIIEKRLTLNTDGYILDIFNLNFQKIKLESSDGCIVRGRIGHAIAASSHDEWKDLMGMSTGESDDAFSDRTSGEGSTNSPIFNDGSSHHSNSSNLNLNQTTPRSTNSPKSAPTFMKLPVSGSVTDSISSVTASAAASSTTVYEQDSVVSPKVEHPQPRKPHLNHMSSEFLTSSKNDSPVTPSTQGTNTNLSKTNTLSKTETGSSQRSGVSRVKSTTSSTHSPTMSKNFGSVLLKSSKLFHRNHQRTASANPQQVQQQLQPPLQLQEVQEQTQGAQLPASTIPQDASLTNPSAANTPSTSSIAPPNNYLSNTYSRQVKQHRSNSNQSSGGSRPTSPIGLPLLSNAHVKPFTSRIITETSVSRKESELHKASPKAGKKQPSKSDEYYTFSPVMGPTKPAPVKNVYDENESEKSYDFETISVFIFGGFVSADADSKYTSKFVATDDLFTVQLTAKRLYADFVDFKDLAILYEMGKHANDGHYSEGDLWPRPRGFFASSIINVNSTIEDNCQINLYITKSGQSDVVIDDEGDESDKLYSKSTRSLSSSSSSSSVSSISGTTPRKNGLYPTTSKKILRASEFYFKGKALLIQGGVNENYETFSDFYLYVFETGKWQTMSTYTYDYFNSPLQPYEDDDISKLTQENAKADTELIEAELRSCHHHALYYQNEGRDYLFFMGGLNNDYLRKFDNEDNPYTSDKFDVLRLSRFQFASRNYFVSRIMVLNLQTQTWRFLRYYYNVNHVMNESFMSKILENPSWINARICNLGGSFTLSGKTITIGHGLMIPVPEKKEDFEKLSDSYPTSTLLWGGYFSWTFPGL